MVVLYIKLLFGYIWNFVDTYYNMLADKGTIKRGLLIGSQH